MPEKNDEKNGNVHDGTHVCMCCGYGAWRGHRALRVVVALVIAFVIAVCIFFVGVKVGQFSSRFHGMYGGYGRGYGGGYRMMLPGSSGGVFNPMIPRATPTTTVQ